MLLSIIVPVYNSEKFISKCLNSILVEKDIQLECVVINDGSTDNSEEIIKDFVKKDSRIKYYSTSNHGVSSARNLGILNSNGDKLMFVDSDDYLVEGAWETIKKALQNCMTDLIVFNYYEERSKKQKKAIPTINSNNSTQEILKELAIENNYLNSACGKIFDSKLIKKHGINFPTYLYFAEDACFVLDYLKYCTKINVVDETIFIYQMHSNNSIEKYDMSRLNCYEVEMSYRIQLMEHLNLNKSLPLLYYNYFKMISFFFIAYFGTMNLRECKNKIKYIIENSFVITLLNNTNIKNCNFYEKILYLLLKNKRECLGLTFLKIMSLIRKIKKKIY